MADPRFWSHYQFRVRYRHQRRFQRWSGNDPRTPELLLYDLASILWVIDEDNVWVSVIPEQRRID